MDKEQIIIDGEIYNYCNGCELWNGHHCTGDRSYEFNGENHRMICDKHMAHQFWKIRYELIRKTQECEELKEKLSAANLEIENLKKELDKAYEWEQTNRATGICETCTEKANLTLDIYRDGMNKIEKLINKIKESGYNE